MHIKTIFKLFGAALLSVLLAACGGGGKGTAVPEVQSAAASSKPASTASKVSSGASVASKGSSGTSVGAAGSSTPKSSSPASSIAGLPAGTQLGNGSGTTFVSGAIGSTIADSFTVLFAEGSARLSLSIVNASGVLLTESISSIVVFSSPCLDAGLATITEGLTIAAKTSTITANYKPTQCVGADKITATVTSGNTVLSANTTLKVNNKRLGTGTGVSFIPTKVVVADTALFENQTTSFSLDIVDDVSSPVMAPTVVTFSSPCLTAGTSTITGGNAITSIAGKVSAEYKVGSCSSEDTVTASIDYPNSVNATAIVPIDTRRIGAGYGTGFVDSSLDIGIGTSPLSPGGTTTITASIVNSKGGLVADPMDVIFTSPCLSAANAAITGGTTVKTVNGKAIATYTATGCVGVSGIDKISASTVFRNSVLTATADLTVSADSAQSISFVDATPQLINIKGTGGTETSALRFRVFGQSGSPVKGTCVTFAPSTTVGGIALVPSKCNPAGAEIYGASTDASGYASIIVQTGTVATAVRVTATTANGLSTQSSALAVTTGIPDQNSVSLSLTDTAPIGWDYDGVESKANIRMADAFNNPVPDGTAVTFTSNGGSIDGSCSTVKGACTVSWRSQQPRPVSSNKVIFNDTTLGMSCTVAASECRSGRIKILASAIGNESFIDGNGNGLYDDITKDIFVNSNGIYNATTKSLSITNTALCSLAVPLSSAAGGATNSCDDLREAYIDKNFNGDYGADEEFVDFNQNSTFDLLPNGKYDGALCSGTAKVNGDCTSNKVTVRDDITLVMSCTTPFFQPGTSRLPGQPVAPIPVSNNQLVNTFMRLADCNGNGMPAGTTISVITTNLLNATASVSPSTLPMSQEPTVLALSITGGTDPTKPVSGNVIIRITSTSISGSLATDIFVPVTAGP